MGIEKTESNEPIQVGGSGVRYLHDGTATARARTKSGAHSASYLAG